MSTTDVAVPQPNTLAEARQIPDYKMRLAAIKWLNELVDAPEASRPVPRFMLNLPWADEASERIIATVLASDDPYSLATTHDAAKVTGGKSLVGQKVTVHDLACVASSEPNGWGAFLLLDCVIGDDDETHQVVSIGAKQAVATLAYAFQVGDFPITGTFFEVARSKEGNQVLGFIVEPPL